MSKAGTWMMGVLASALVVACSQPVPPPAVIEATPAPAAAPQRPSETPHSAATPIMALATPTRTLAQSLEIGWLDAAACAGTSGPLQCRLVQVLAAWEWLRAHPDHPSRAAIQNALEDNAGSGVESIDLAWVADRRALALARNLLATGQSSPGWTRTDLDGDGAADYLLSTGTAPMAHDMAGEQSLYWVRPTASGPQFELIHRQMTSPIPQQVFASDDLTGDGRIDLAYVSGHCGASTCFPLLTVLSRLDAIWVRRPIQAGDTLMNGEWRLIEDVHGQSQLEGIRRGPGSTGFGPWLSISVRYEWDGTAFWASEIAAVEEPQRDHAVAFQWVKKLVRLGRLGEARLALDALISEFPLGVDPERPRYDIYYRFQSGVLHMLAGDTEAARQTWAGLLRADRRADTVVALLSATRQLDRTDPAWHYCARSLAQIPVAAWSEDVWAEPDSRRTPADPFALCVPNQRLALVDWPRTQPIASRAESLGIGWSPLREDVDLDGDGVADPVGLVDGVSVIFLSDAEAPLALGSWTPFLVTNHRQAYPGVEVTDEGPYFQAEADPSLPSPRVEWDGRQLRFSLGGEPTNVWLACTSQACAVEAPCTPNACGPVRTAPDDLLSASIRALYGDQDPGQALALLKGYPSEIADPWLLGLARYLEARAREQLNDPDQAAARTRARQAPGGATWGWLFDHVP